MSDSSHNDWSFEPGPCWYATRYKGRDGHQYGDEIWAENLDQAIWFCIARGQDEVVDSVLHKNHKRPPYKTPSEMLRRPVSRWDWQHLIHCAAHVTHLAVAAGHSSPVKLLDDVSPLHHLTHLMGLQIEAREERSSLKRFSALRRQLIQDFATLEATVPGLRRNSTHQ